MSLIRIKRNVFLFWMTMLVLIPVCCCNHTSSRYSGNILFDFEDEEELNLFRWKCKTLFSLAKEYNKHGNRSLRLEFFPSRQVGFSTNRIEHDWNHVKGLEFTVFNPSTRAVDIHLHISDDSTKGDPSRAFKKTLPIAPGENIIVVAVSDLCDSSSRKLNYSAIKGFYIFMKKISFKTVLYFDYFRLI